MKVIGGYIVPFIMLVIGMLGYLKLASRLNIIDKPNQRSSHNTPTINGGGIIFLLSAVLSFLWNGYSYPYLLAAMLLSGILSFIDDIGIVNNRLKFSAHILSVFLLFRECDLLTILPPFYLIAIAILITGVINAYNFMDGINGITGLYSLAVIVPLSLTETSDKLQSLELFSIMGLLVFNFFNTRKNAICFAGDVGSISIAILIAFLLITRIQQTAHLEYIAMLMVYGIDATYTIGQRFFQRENVFKPHRKHLYQYYSNEKKVSHVGVSMLYTCIQLSINLGIVYSYLDYATLLILLIILSIVYWLLKIPFLKISAN